MTDTQSPSAPGHEQAQQAIEQLKARVERAERRMKALQFSIPALAVLICAALLMQLDRPTVIGAKSMIAETFSVRNAGGDIVAQLGAGRDGSPSIAFLDANNKIRLMMAVGVRGPSVALLDPQGVSRAILSLNGKSEPSLTMTNAEKLTRGVLAIDTGGSGHLVLYGTAGGLDLAAHDGHVRWTPAGGAPADALMISK